MNIGKLNGFIPGSILSIMPDAFAKYQINTELRAAHFLAQVGQESGNFANKTENMFYSTPQRIAAVWPSRFNMDGSDGKKNANDYIKNPAKLAEAVYGGRMGNDQPGDGFRYRGGGFLQLTGKDAYIGYANYLGKDTGTTADLMRSDDTYALDSALWEYVLSMGLNQTADTGSSDAVITTITKRVNGGTIGLTQRISNFHKYFDVLNTPG
jgi:putative chitinase